MVASTDPFTPLRTRSYLGLLVLAMALEVPDRRGGMLVLPADVVLPGAFVSAAHRVGKVRLRGVLIEQSWVFVREAAVVTWQVTGCVGQLVAGLRPRLGAGRAAPHGRG